MTLKNGKVLEAAGGCDCMVVEDGAKESFTKVEGRDDVSGKQKFPNDRGVAAREDVLNAQGDFAGRESFARCETHARSHENTRGTDELASSGFRRFEDRTSSSRRNPNCFPLETGRQDPWSGRSEMYSSSQQGYGPMPRKPRKQIDPELFEGNGSVDDYLESFEEIAQWNRWDDEEMAMQLAMCLTGSARVAMKILPAGQRRSYQSICKVLRETFGHGDSSVMLLQREFWNKVKGFRQSFSEFANDLQMLAYRAFSGMVTEGRGFRALEDLLINQFVTGLGDAKLGRYIYLQHPTSLQQAASLARDYEAFNRLGGDLVPRARSNLHMVRVEDSDEEKEHVPVEDANSRLELEDPENAGEEEMSDLMEETVKHFLVKKHWF